MISASTAAGLIAGMTQSTRDLGQRWEALSEEQRFLLLASWQQAIDERPSEAPCEIIASIAQHPFLSGAWRGLGSNIHESRFFYIEAIVRSTITADLSAT